MLPVVLDRIGAGGRVLAGEKSNDGIRAAANINPGRSIFLDRIIADRGEARLVHLNAEACGSLYSVTIDNRLTASIYDYAVSTSCNCESFYGDPSSSHLDRRDARISAVDRRLPLAVKHDSNDVFQYS